MKKRISSNVDVMLVNRYGITVKKCCASCQHNERGKVQRREYQLTLMEVRASESLAMQRGLTITPKKLEDIQQEFETEHGSRFLIH